MIYGCDVSQFILCILLVISELYYVLLCFACMFDCTLCVCVCVSDVNTFLVRHSVYSY